MNCDDQQRPKCLTVANCRPSAPSTPMPPQANIRPNAVAINPTKSVSKRLPDHVLATIAQGQRMKPSRPGRLVEGKVRSHPAKRSYATRRQERAERPRMCRAASSLHHSSPVMPGPCPQFLATCITNWTKNTCITSRFDLFSAMDRVGTTTKANHP